MVLRTLEPTIGRKVEIDPAAKALAECTSVTIRGGDHVKVSKLLDLVRKRLEPKGLLLEESGDHLVLKQAPGAKPCPAKKPQH